MGWGPQIFIKTMSGQTLSFWFKDVSVYTVKNLKSFIFKKIHLPSTCQRFIYSGKNFVDNNLHLLNDLHIPREGTIHLLLRWHGVGCRCNPCSNITLLRNGKRIIK